MEKRTREISYHEKKIAFNILQNDSLDKETKFNILIDKCPNINKEMDKIIDEVCNDFIVDLQKEVHQKELVQQQQLKLII